MSEDLRTRQAIDRLLVAIESRDLRAVHAALHPNASWQNVPHPASEGRPAVMVLLASILCWSDQVRWDVISSSVDGEVGWYERIDRFWLRGEEHAVRCNGVFKVDPDTDTVREVRDYVDLGEWRARVTPVLQSLATRSAEEGSHSISAQWARAIRSRWRRIMHWTLCWLGPTRTIPVGLRSPIISRLFRCD